MGFLDRFSTRYRLRVVEEALEKLDREVRGMQSEWANTLDKVNRMMGRLAKRAQIDARAEELSEQAELPLTGRPLTLSERQSRIQAEIEERRRKGVSNVLPRGLHES